MRKLIGILILLAVGIGAGIVLDRSLPGEMGQKSAAESGERKVAYWVGPMNPNFRSDKPGKSPMGMDLIPVYEDEMNGGDDSNAIRIAPSVVNNLGVRTAKVEQGSFRSQIETVGYIDYDESKINHVNLRAEGWIEKLYVDSVGERVKQGDPLFDVYSPELVNAQSDYLNALNTGRTGIISASKERLRALGIPKDAIAALDKKRRVSQFVKIRAPRDGIVATLKVREGMHVQPMITTISLADLSTVWLLVDVFETQANWIKEDLPAEVRLSYEPGRVWQGKITYVYPQIDPKTRTLKTRLEFENPGELLKPDMYADVTIMGEERPGTLMIPREALIRTGKSERVILALGEGKFRPAKVKAGQEAGGKVEILEGLAKDEEVVTSAQFLIDSEASFTGSSLRMSPPQTNVAPVDHSQMDHSSQDQAEPSAEDHSQMEETQ